MDQDILEALKEVALYKKGDVSLAVKDFEFKAFDIQNLRERYDLSQLEFARLFGVSLRTLQQWEHGRRTPQGPAQVLLKVIAYNPKVVEEALRHH